MDETGFTPGPWEWDLYARGWFLVGAPPAHSTVRQAVKISHATADGRLIAASPSMFDYIAERAAEGDEKAIAIVEAINAPR